MFLCIYLIDSFKLRRLIVSILINVFIPQNSPRVFAKITVVKFSMEIQGAA